MRTMKTYFIKVLMILGVAVFIASCEKEDPTAFTADASLNFSKDSLNYSFLGNNTGEYIAEIPVHITGQSVNYDRSFSLEVVEGTDTNASADLYEILGGIIPANDFKGSLKIKVLNSEELDTEVASLKIRLTDSEDFDVRNNANREYLLKWTNKIVVPNWQWFKYFFTRYSSTRAYKIYVEVTGLTNFTLDDYRALGPTGAQALGKAYGDYIREYNSEHPDALLTHDDGDHAGEEIIPVY